MANGTLAASQLEMLSQSGTGIITITPPATNTNRAITLPDAAGAIVVSGTTPSLNGITFPATQVASAGANTLDDYEEGTWTPQLRFNNASVGMTYSVQTGKYTRIGNAVCLGFAILLSNKGSSTGTAQIVGIPFLGTFTLTVVPIYFYAGMNGVTATVGTAYMDNAQSTIFELRSASSGSNLTDANFTNVSYFWGTATYFV